MGKRVFCLLFAAILTAVSLFGIRPAAEAWVPEKAISPPALVLSTGIVSTRANPLVSAMFLVLGGIGISMLFDKKK